MDIGKNHSVKKFLLIKKFVKLKFQVLRQSSNISAIFLLQKCGSFYSSSINGNFQ